MGGGTHGSRPTGYFCRAGPACPAVSAGKPGRADVGIGPHGSAIRGAMGGRPQGSPLRKRYKGGRGERNPPVTAAPCQPPLGKGALRTGDADCHSQCAHWLRNDTLQGVRYGGPMWASAPTEGLQGVQCKIGGRTEASAPTEAQQEVQWAGDRKGRPYGGVARGA